MRAAKRLLGVRVASTVAGPSAASLHVPLSLRRPAPSAAPPQVSRYGIPVPRAFLQQHFPEGLALDSAFVAPSVVDQVEASVEEALSAGSWWVLQLWKGGGAGRQGGGGGGGRGGAGRCVQAGMRGWGALGWATEGLGRGSGPTMGEGSSVCA